MTIMEYPCSYLNIFSSIGLSLIITLQWFVKFAFKFDKPCMVCLINQSFELDVIPHFLHISNITPLHKTGDDKLFNDYNRPISLNCQFAIILEKIFYFRYNLL